MIISLKLKARRCTLKSKVRMTNSMHYYKSNNAWEMLHTGLFKSSLIDEINNDVLSMDDKSCINKPRYSIKELKILRDIRGRI